MLGELPVTLLLPNKILSRIELNGIKNNKPFFERAEILLLLRFGHLSGGRQWI